MPMKRGLSDARPKFGWMTHAAGSSVPRQLLRAPVACVIVQVLNFRCSVGPDQYDVGLPGSTPVEATNAWVPLAVGELIIAPLWNCAEPAMDHPPIAVRRK